MKNTDEKMCEELFAKIREKMPDTAEEAIRRIQAGENAYAVIDELKSREEETVPNMTVKEYVRIHPEAGKLPDDIGNDELIRLINS